MSPTLPEGCHVPEHPGFRTLGRDPPPPCPQGGPAYSPPPPRGWKGLLGLKPSGEGDPGGGRKLKTDYDPSNSHNHIKAHTCSHHPKKNSCFMGGSGSQLHFFLYSTRAVVSAFLRILGPRVHCPKIHLNEILIILN